MSSIVSVSQLNRYLSLKIGGDLKLRGITVRGELSDFKIHYKSGHAYFTLKDDTSLLKGIMFSRSVERLGFMPESGMNVLCSGNIEVYEAGGVYQIIATELIPAGIGAKFMQLNALKEKLSKQGYFDEQRKKNLPTLPKRIAVVTSLGGAALQDVLNILRRRYPVAEVLVFPAQVQGETAHKTIVKALAAADSSGSDVIILARGGGSFEDLMPFNTEEVAVAVACCETPVVSAVGHETDTTLADYVADKRAPTPSAAAEICSPTMEQMYAVIDTMRERLASAYEKALKQRSETLSSLELRLQAVSPDINILNSIATLKGLEERLNRAAADIVSKKSAQLEKYSASLNALSPYKVLERGYTITLKNGAAVSSFEQLDKNDEITVRFKDFAVTAKITDITRLTD